MKCKNSIRQENRREKQASFLAAGRELNCRHQLIRERHDKVSRLHFPPQGAKGLGAGRCDLQQARKAGCTPAYAINSGSSRWISDPWWAQEQVNVVSQTPSMFTIEQNSITSVEQL